MITAFIKGSKFVPFPVRTTNNRTVFATEGLGYKEQAPALHLLAKPV